MIIHYDKFADIYNDLFSILPQCEVDIECRGKSICYEMLNVQLVFNTVKHSCNKISIYSHQLTRAFPIKFAVAEFVWIMAKSNDLAFIERYNKAMRLFSDDDRTLFGAYGVRIGNQIYQCIRKLLDDKYSRQAFVTIYDKHDIFSGTKDVPCNTSLQFMIRNNELILTVNSRSSDFITGLPIDAFHWQLLLALVFNELHASYPELESGHVVYNIASLHVYSTDKDALDSFAKRHIVSRDYSHTLQVFSYETYTNVIRCSLDFVARSFAADIDIDNVNLVINFDILAHAQITNLQNIFKNRVHRFVR